MNGSFVCGGGPCNTVDSSPTSTRLGWTVGLGFEYMLGPNWSVFVEYDYMNFGNPTISFPGTVPVNSFQIAQHVQTVMIGLNLISAQRRSSRRDIDRRIVVTFIPVPACVQRLRAARP